MKGKGGRTGGSKCTEERAYAERCEEDCGGMVCMTIKSSSVKDHDSHMRDEGEREKKKRAE